MSELQKPVSKPEKAINDYLESLLMEVPDEVEQTKLNVKSVENVVVKLVPHDEPADISPVVGLDQLVAEVPLEIPDVVETVKLEEKQIEQVEEQALIEKESIVPDWAEERFQCLLFKVSGLSLAVPLVKLNSVIPWDKNITETPNQTDWYLGLVQHLQSQVKIIDTALLVVPENRRENIDADIGNRMGHILLVDDFKWGLACDSIGDVIWLTKDEIKWRKNKSQRPWLSGTSLEHLCAIMDTEVFAKMLTEEE